LVSKSSNKLVEDATGQAGNQLRSVTTGLLTNVLNPKALIFFITVFAVAINKETGIFVKSLLGIYMSVATFIWFALVSILLTNKKAIERFKKAIPLLEKVTGFFLLLIAIQILFQQTY